MPFVTTCVPTSPTEKPLKNTCTWILHATGLPFAVTTTLYHHVCLSTGWWLCAVTTTFSVGTAAAVGAAPTSARTKTRANARRTPRTLRDETGQLSRRGTERARVLEHRREQVAVPLDALEDGLHAEVTRPHVLRQLVPAQRRRHRSTRLRPHRVDRRDGLPPAVLAMVDEHAGSLLLQPLGRDLPGCRCSSRRDAASANAYVSSKPARR